MSEVVRLRDGAPLAHPGNPDESVIAALEKLLAAAKAGEITGIAYATQFYDKAVGGTFAGTYSRAQVGRLFAIMADISRRIDHQ